MSISPVDILYRIPDSKLPKECTDSAFFFELLVDSDGHLSRVFAVHSKDAWLAAIPSFGDTVSVVEFVHVGNDRDMGYLYVCNRHQPTYSKRLDDSWQPDQRIDSFRGEHAQ